MVRSGQHVRKMILAAVEDGWEEGENGVPWDIGLADRILKVNMSLPFGVLGLLLRSCPWRLGLGCFEGRGL